MFQQSYVMRAAVIGAAALATACSNSGQSGDAESSSASSVMSAASTYETLVDSQGNISKPADFATRWSHIGSWGIVNESGEGNGIHSVYTTPDVIAHFKENGAYPDGAVLIKEVRAAEGADLTTGRAHWATDPQVWFVMVKDTQNRFPGNPLWGEGWGWALFNADAPDVQVATDYQADCLGCHLPVQDADWVYTFAYPELATAAVKSASMAGGMAMMSGNDDAIARPEFTSDGAVKMPADWRKWVYVGTPLTPNALNGGAAPFPEFHNVYIEQSAYRHFKNTGEFAEGTQIAKELVLVRESENGNDATNGSSAEVSGQGYFQGDFQGLELAYKDNARYPDEPGGWVYFSFGHKPEPYEKTAEAFPTEACNSCHEVNAATDFTFTQFYPVLRAAQNSN